MYFINAFAGTCSIHDGESFLFLRQSKHAIMVLSANILDQTPEVIAKWPKANYDNPDQLTWLPIYSCIWFGVATIMVAMRFWLRSRGHAGRLGLDDVSSKIPLLKRNKNADKHRPFSWPPGSAV
jgi:hypothetical protein